MKTIISICMSLICVSAIAQAEESNKLEYAFNGVWKSGEVNLDSILSCLDVKNGTLASFKMTLMIDNGAKVLQFKEAGRCFSQKAMEALSTSDGGTQVMFSEVMQVTENGGRQSIDGKNFTVAK